MRYFIRLFCLPVVRLGRPNKQKVFDNVIIDMLDVVTYFMVNYHTNGGPDT